MKRPKRSRLEELLFWKLRAHELLDGLVEEFPFLRWRFDFAWYREGVAAECEGGTWKGHKGRHTSGIGFQKDCDKYNTATLDGWRVFRFTEYHINSGNAVDVIREALNR